jgi:two-component system, sensor histidine kinase ChiS
LVDDNESNLLSLAGILKMENYAVTAVTSSRDFYEEFKASDDVSLVILDVMLPGSSGYDICKEIRNSFSVFELPILILTARTTTLHIVAGMKAGANDYLAKPFDGEELLVRVNTLIQFKVTVDKAMAAEMAFLRAQIKPHFLYNALNTIISISRGDPENARNLLINLSDYLRRSFDFKDLTQFVPLKNELDLTKAYVEIEKARFEERLEVNFTLIGDLEVNIPVLMIQPLLENAIIHGILPKPAGGRVDVAIKRYEQTVQVIIKDNGIGMDKTKLREALANDGKNGIGISNIERRLKKLFGTGLEIKSNPGVGTEVILNIPIRINGDATEND